MRIAVGGIHAECCTYNPVHMVTSDFTLMQGDNLLTNPYFSLLADYPQATFLPTIHARNIAGGRLTADTYAGFKADFLQRLRAFGPVDGVYLAMHGALYVDGMEDAEGDWITATREVVGPNVPISASYDMHGSVSQKIIDALDMFSTYRTAPHIDIPETMRRAVTMLVRAIEEKTWPILLWAKIPVLLNGERTSTEDEPAKTMYAALPQVDAIPGVWDTSLMVGYVWGDEPRATAAAIMTGTDRAVLEREAKRLAQDYWDQRDNFVFGPVTDQLGPCLDQAETITTRPLILADSGDNPTAGGVGDRPDVLRELVARKLTGAMVVGIVDPPAVNAAFQAGEGKTFTAQIGAALDPSSGPPVSATARVVKLMNPGPAPEREAVLDLNGIQVVVSAKRRPYHNLADFQRLGLDPKTARMVVVKSGYLSPELAPIANPNLMALTRGCVDQLLERLPNERRPSPLYPFTRDFPFRPEAVLSARSKARGA